MSANDLISLWEQTISKSSVNLRKKSKALFVSKAYMALAPQSPIFYWFRQYDLYTMRALGGHHPILGCTWWAGFIYFNPARRRAEIYIFITCLYTIELKYIIYFMQSLPEIIYFKHTPPPPSLEIE